MDSFKVLLQHPDTDPNLQDNIGFTPLFFACHLGHLEYVEELLQDDRVDVNLPQFEGASPLLACAENSAMDVVRLLLRHHNIDPNLADYNGSSPLMVACGFQNEELTRLLLADPRCNQGEDAPGGFTPFHELCESGNLTLARLFLEQGLRGVNLRRTDGRTPLLSCCLHNRTEILKHLLLHCPDVDAVSPLDKEASIKAAGQPFWTHFLNGFAQDWITPRDIAIAKGHTEIADILDFFVEDPARCRRVLGKQLGITGRLIADTFALVVFVCDDFYTLRGNRATTSAATTATSATSATTWPKILDTAEGSSKLEGATRYLQIASQLHLDLQMVLCNRTWGLARDLIPCQEREAAFKKLSKHALPATAWGK